MRQRMKNRRPGHGSAAARRQPHNHSNRYSKGVSRQPVYVGQKVIGYVQNGVFTKSVQASKHFLRRPRAIAFDVSTLHDAEQAGARRVEVKDTETGRVYQLPLSTVWAKGWRFNRGFGEQWGVHLDHWFRPGEQVAEQPSLFGGAL